MKLAMVTTNYRITYYIHFRKEGFKLYQLKERGRLPSIPGQTSDNIVGGRGGLTAKCSTTIATFGITSIADFGENHLFR